MVHPTAPTPPNDGVSLTGPRRTALTHLLVLAHNPPPQIHADTHLKPMQNPSTSMATYSLLNCQLPTNSGS